MLHNDGTKGHAPFLQSFKIPELRTSAIDVAEIEPIWCGDDEIYYM